MMKLSRLSGPIGEIVPSIGLHLEDSPAWLSQSLGKKSHSLLL